jgi:hypothetical protein
MPSFTGKTFASFYKNILGINQSSNTGVDATGRKIQDGAGNNTAISLSDDDLSVNPVNDDTVRTFRVQKQNNSTVFSVDTTNSKVLAGASQVSVNTFYQTFSAYNIAPVAGEHMPLLTAPATYFGTTSVEMSLGSGTDPATTYDMSTGNLANNLLTSIFMLPHNVTLDSASVLFTVTSSDDETLNFHIMSYAIRTDNGSNSGDLSSGVVVADSAEQTVDRTSIDYLALAIKSADVDAGRVLIGTVESTSTEQVSANMILTYHIR